MNTDTSKSDASLGSERVFSFIIDSAEEAIALLNNDGVVRYANLAWIRMHGYERRDDVVNKPISSFHNKEQLKDIVLPFLQEVIHRGYISGPVGHIDAGGKVIPTNTTMLALKDNSGKIKGIIVFSSDTSGLEMLRQELAGIKSELDKRTFELKSVIEQHEQKVRELTMVEDLLGARGIELSQVNKKLWEYMSVSTQSKEQLKFLHEELAEKDKQLADCKNRLQQQNNERLRIDQYWKKQFENLTSVIEKLRMEVMEMKHQEVEFLDGIEDDAVLAGSKGELALDQIKELSEMAKKFAGR